MEKLKIVSAAIRYKDKIYTGKRHAEIMGIIWEEEGTTDAKFLQEDQGFLASDEKFYNRFQSGAIAYMAGQTKERKQVLLSDHLW